MKTFSTQYLLPDPFMETWTILQGSPVLDFRHRGKVH